MAPLKRNQTAVGSLGVLFKTLCGVSLLASLSAGAQSISLLTGSGPESVLARDPRESGVWQKGIGEGFQPTTQTLSLATGAAGGVLMFGGRQHHDLALVSLAYGHMLGRTVGEGHWYRGNWEYRLELFSGAQFAPSGEWLVGLTPHLRYDFATGTRWVPFVDAGAGLTATGIGAPDLSHIYEFNLQAGAGVHWFFRDHLALTVESRYLHLSCAGLSTPNLGLNSFAGMLGMTWFF